MNKKINLLFIVIATVTKGFGQATDDAGLWATFNLDKKLHDKFSLFLTEECRTRENFSRINLFYTDLGAEYRPAKFLKVALSYRLIEKNLIDESFSFRHRVMLDITLKKKVGNFVLSYRNRTQREVRDVNSSELGYLPEWYSRNKVTVKYDFDKPVTPYVATEWRYQISNPRDMNGDGIWSRARFVAGLDYKKSDKHTFGLYYLVQREFNIAAPQNLYIVGLEYSLSL